MANRSNHYEAAFEAYLRSERIAYVAVDEQRRALAEHESLKSVDYIVSPDSGGLSWLVDVKGRRFPAGARRQYWKNWSTLDDLDSLVRWRARFGAGFEAALVFAYLLTSDVSPVPAEQVFTFRENSYAFVGIPLDRYARRARRLSPRWQTYAMPAKEFRAAARCVTDLFFTGPAGVTPRRRESLFA